MNTKSEDIKIYNPKTGKEMEVPLEGSLGLLALGAVGLRAWRVARKKSRQQNKPDKEI